MDLSTRRRAACYGRAVHDSTTSAVALLVRQTGTTAAQSEELLFEPELVVRGSTGPAPGRVLAQGGPLGRACVRCAAGRPLARRRAITVTYWPP
jgi:hypothetical protein